MKHFFLDTNVLIDFLANRKPFARDAAKLFNYGLKNELTIYVAAVSYNNIYYILKQTNTHRATIAVLAELQEWTTGIAVDQQIIRNALKSDFKDFEDAIQYHCALGISQLDGIVTRDTKDFKTSTLAVFTPLEAVAIMKGSLS